MLSATLFFTRGHKHCKNIDVRGSWMLSKASNFMRWGEMTSLMCAALANLCVSTAICNRTKLRFASELQWSFYVEFMPFIKLHYHQASQVQNSSLILCDSKLQQVLCKYQIVWNQSASPVFKTLRKGKIYKNCTHTVLPFQFLLKFHLNFKFFFEF